MFTIKRKVKENFSIMIIPSHIKEFLRMECLTVKGLQHQRMELNLRLNGLMALMLVFFDLFLILLLFILNHTDIFLTFGKFDK